MIPSLTNKDEFEKLISENVVVVVIFFKDDCEECTKVSNNLDKELIPHFDKIEKISVIKIDVTNEFFKNYFKISEVPTTITFYKGQIVSFKEMDEKGNVYTIDRFIGNNPDLAGNLFRMITHLIQMG